MPLQNVRKLKNSYGFERTSQSIALLHLWVNTLLLTLGLEDHPISFLSAPEGWNGRDQVLQANVVRLHCSSYQVRATDVDPTDNISKSAYAP